MFWNYLVESANSTRGTIKDAFWFCKVIFFVLYVAFCLAVAFCNLSIKLSIALLIVCFIDIAVFVARLIIEYTKTSVSGNSAKTMANSLAVLKAVRMLVRILTVIFTFAVTVMAYENGEPKALELIALIIALFLLMVVVSQEIVMTIVRYVKYKTTQRINILKEMVNREVISGAANFRDYIEK